MKTHSINPRALGTASLTNAIMAASKQPKPEMGMGATVVMYTDRYACDIVAVRNHGKTVYVQECKVTRTDGNGQSESQDYDYQPNPDAPVQVFTLRNTGRYVKRGESANGGTHGSVQIRKRLRQDSIPLGTPPDNSPCVVFRFWRFGRVYGDYRDHLPFHIRFSSRYLLSLWPDLFLLRRFLVWSKSQGEPESSVPLLQWSRQILGTPTYLALQFDRLLLCIPFLALVWCRCDRETAIGLWRSYYGDLVKWHSERRTPQ